jgi:hypothetical protein
MNQSQQNKHIMHMTYHQLDRQYGAAGFPTEDTWIKAIKAGNYNTWPTITPETVQRHFPESDET